MEIYVLEIVHPYEGADVIGLNTTLEGAQDRAANYSAAPSYIQSGGWSMHESSQGAYWNTGNVLVSDPFYVITVHELGA